MIVKITPILFLITFFTTFWAGATNVLPNEDGYRLWLRYTPVKLARPQKQQSIFSNIYINVKTETGRVIAAELATGLAGMLGIQPQINPVKKAGTFVEISAGPGYGITKKELKKAGNEGYIIKTIQHKKNKIIVIKSSGDAGLLYGAFHLLRLLQTNKPVDKLNITESPELAYRMLNQWDNLDGSVERGYSGKSIYKWDHFSDHNIQRYVDFARANASIGINAVVLNNVNADPRILRHDYLQKVAKLVNIFRPYNIKVFLSANFAAPLPPSSTPDVLKKWGGIGSLSGADPLNKNVQQWWKNKIDEIYSLIPDFGGFLIKANSEGMPGPQDYGRSHADGANMLAKLLQPHNGILIWRAFVYAHSNKEPDRAKQSYNEFYPLDGKFENNVVLQVKNGPLDFQPLEPPHPLFGALKKTNLFAELQITQEYLGHSTYLVYLAPMWKQFLEFKNHNNSIANIIGKDYPAKITGIAGVSNAGDDRNWTGHHFAQANWFAYGRLAWNPQELVDSITTDWLKMTWTTDESAIDKLRNVMNHSWINFSKLQTPMGLVVTTDPAAHYHPALKRRANTYWKINSEGIGYNRTTSGSGYVNQYDNFNKQLFNNLATCPEEYLLFFHFVKYHHRLQNGKTLKENLLDGFQESITAVNELNLLWHSLKNIIDKQRYDEVLQKIEQQKKDALAFQKAFIDLLNSY